MAGYGLLPYWREVAQGGNYMQSHTHARVAWLANHPDAPIHVTLLAPKSWGSASMGLVDTNTFGVIFDRHPEAFLLYLQPTDGDRVGVALRIAKPHPGDARWLRLPQVGMPTGEMRSDYWDLTAFCRCGAKITAPFGDCPKCAAAEVQPRCPVCGTVLTAVEKPSGVCVRCRGAGWHRRTDGLVALNAMDGRVASLSMQAGDD